MGTDNPPMDCPIEDCDYSSHDIEQMEIHLRLKTLSSTI
jgi:hypothetical protein